jgi:glycosyltransferase involved in cell wall biosynthesis
MKTNPLISIIIPTYNRAHLISETLDSVLAQTYQNWECIIVDDGSSDHTEEVVGTYAKKDSRFNYYQRPNVHLPGGNGARNFGFKMSQGKYIQWFDSDDLMVPEKLSLFINNYSKENEVVFSGHSVFNNNRYQIIERSIFENNIPLFRCLVTGQIKLHTSSSFWKKSFLTTCKLFDENLKKGQELEFYSRIFFENQLSYSHTKHSTSLIRPQDNGIMSDYIKKDKIDHISSFLYVRSHIHMKTIIDYNPNVFFETFSFYEKTLSSLVKRKKFNIVKEQLKFLKQNRPKSHTLMYSLKLKKIYFLNSLMKLFNGNGYYFFKKIINI